MTEQNVVYGSLDSVVPRMCHQGHFLRVQEKIILKDGLLYLALGFETDENVVRDQVFS